MIRTWHCLWILAVVVVTACGMPQPTADGTVEPIGDPPPTDVVPAADCAAPAEPGPADAPPDGSGDGMDFSDYGAARWSLCLTGPTVASIEARAMCLWSPDRQSVLEVSGVPTRIGEIDYDAWVALQRGEFQLSTTDHRQGGQIATYTPGANQPLGEATDEGRVGLLTFDVTLLIDPESGPPPGAPPRHVGTMRWICGDPPPPA